MDNLFVHREQVRKNVFSNTLNKGMISDAFGYDRETKYPKTGAQMREVLEKVLLSKKDKLQAIATRCAELKGFSGLEPTENTPDYFFPENKTEEILAMCPFAGKMYIETMCYLDSDMDSTVVPKGFATAKEGFAATKEIADCCNEYNSLIRACCEICNEISLAKTLYDNVVEDQTYYLTLTQLRALNL